MLEEAQACRHTGFGLLLSSAMCLRKPRPVHTQAFGWSVVLRHVLEESKPVHKEGVEAADASLRGLRGADAKQHKPDRLQEHFLLHGRILGKRCHLVHQPHRRLGFMPDALLLDGAASHNAGQQLGPLRLHLGKCGGDPLPDHLGR